MTTLATVPEGDTTQWAVMSWVCQQGEFLDSPIQHVLLYYLAANSFYEKRNPEGSPVGQVLYQASHYAEIMQGTSIRSRETLRRALNGLGDLAYLTRARRPGGGHQPVKIRVMWDAQMDDYRERLRAGEVPLHPQFMTRPSTKKSEPKRALNLVQSINF